MSCVISYSRSHVWNKIPDRMLGPVRPHRAATALASSIASVGGSARAFTAVPTRGAGQTRPAIAIYRHLDRDLVIGRERQDGEDSVVPVVVDSAD